MTPVQVDNLSLATESSTVQEGTTQYKMENVGVKLDLPLALPANYKASYFPNDVTSIAAYLSKPVPIASGSWSTGDRKSVV